MLSFLSVLACLIGATLAFALYMTYIYVIRPYLLLQFYKKQGIETYFNPIIGDVPKCIENIEAHGDFYYSHKERALRTPKPKAWAVTVSTTVAVLLKDPELIKNYYLNHDQFYEKYIPFIVLLKHLAGDGVLLSDGAIWKRHRKLASAAFNFEFLKEMIPEMTEIANEYLDKLKQKNLDQMDMLAEIQLITGEIVGRIFFGDSFSQYHINGVNITQCLTDLLAEVSIEDQQPRSFLLNAKIIKMGVLPPHKKILKKISDFRAVIKNIAVQRLEELEKEKKDEGNKRRRINLMELFYKQRKQNPQEAFTEDELVDEFITFFLAGTDTTGHLLTMSSYFLLKNPQCREKVFQEIDKQFKDLSSISFDTLNKMDYVTAFMKETLRMSPIGGVLFARVATQDNDLGGLMIKKGTIVNLAFLSNYYDPDYHTDPETFMPERWMEEGKTKKNVAENAFIYTPFSAATRNCIGQHLAMNEARIIFSLFMKKFNYSLVDENYRLRMTERFLYEPSEPIIYKLKAK